MSEKFDEARELIAASEHLDYDAAVTTLAEARRVFHEAIAKAIQGKFNDHWSCSPAAKISDKQANAAIANQDLKRLGLAVRSPTSSVPSVLRVDPGHSPEAGRYRIDEISRENGRKMPASSKRWLLVELIPRDDSAETRRETRSPRTR